MWSRIGCCHIWQPGSSVWPSAGSKCQLQTSSYTLVKLQPLTWVPWQKKLITINARRSSSPSHWLETDKLLSASLSLLLAFVQQKKLNMLRHWRRRASCSVSYMLGERWRLHCPWTQKRKLQRRGQSFGSCSGFYLSGQDYQRAVDWVPVSIAERISIWRLLLLGVLRYKTIRGEKGGAELHIFEHWKQISKTECPKVAWQATALQLEPCRTEKAKLCNSDGVKKDADVCWKTLEVGLVS